MPQWTSKFNIGDKLLHIDDGDEELTMRCHSVKFPELEYLISYWNAGQLYHEWIPENELRKVE